MSTLNQIHKISIVIADDHPFFREGLRKVLNSNDKIELLGEASNGQELVALAVEYAPDLLIVDIAMPILNGIEAVTEINQLGIGCKVIALSMHNEDSILLKMLDAGAMSVLDKNASKDELFEAIDTVVLQDRLYFPAATNAKMLSLLQYVGKKSDQESPTIFSERELDVIRLVCADFSNKEIADQLSLSIRTVESHRARIMNRMFVKSVAGLVAFAYSHGIISIDK